MKSRLRPSSLRLVLAALVSAGLPALLACGLPLLSGCTGEGDSPPEAAGGVRRVFKAPEGAAIKLAFVTNNASEFWKVAEQGLAKARRDHGIDIDMKLPSPAKVEEQKKILEDLLTQGYHGIAISVISADDQVRDLDRAAEKTNIITHDSDAAGSNRLAYIGTNNREAGRVLGGEIVELLPDGGTMAVFVGTLAADNARQRLQGVEEVVTPAGIRIVARKEDNKDLTRARSNVEDVISAYPDIDLLCGLWSYNGPAILAAVKASGKESQLKIVAFDGEDGTIEGIAEGTIACTCVQKPFEFGYRSAVLLHDLATRGAAALPEDPVIYTGVEIIDKDSVEAYKAQLSALRE